MERYVATFHTHLAALRSCRALGKVPGTEAKMAPVPRALSSSCGTCVFYQGEEPMAGRLDRDLEAVYRQSRDGYELIYQSESEE